jgi:hypothetical protein
LDTEFLANIADSALPLDDADEPSQAPDTSVDASDTSDDVVLDDSAAHALAAIGLNQLFKLGGGLSFGLDNHHSSS